VDLAAVYWYWGEKYGVRADVAYAQSAKETGFGRFGGVVDRSFCNWCGLKTKNGGANDDPGAHAKFPSDVVGVKAHLQHLSRYAGHPLPEGEEIVDPRYHLVTPGVATTVEGLGGRWAPSKDYGKSVRAYLDSLLAWKCGDEPVTTCAKCQALEAEVKALKERLAQIHSLSDTP
jgi:N-acetylmuramoyl-L-alanine amidase